VVVEVEQVIIVVVQLLDQIQFLAQSHLQVVAVEEVDHTFQLAKMEALAEEVMVVMQEMQETEIHLLFLHLKVLMEETLVNLDHHIWVAEVVVLLVQDQMRLQVLVDLAALEQILLYQDQQLIFLVVAEVEQIQALLQIKEVDQAAELEVLVVLLLDLLLMPLVIMQVEQTKLVVEVDLVVGVNQVEMELMVKLL
jgi:hypothetical protein